MKPWRVIRYWDDNMAQSVLFSQAVEHAMMGVLPPPLDADTQMSLQHEPFMAIIEVGPHPALRSPVLETIRSVPANVAEGNDDVLSRRTPVDRESALSPSWKPGLEESSPDDFQFRNCLSHVTKCMSRSISLDMPQVDISYSNLRFSLRIRITDSCIGLLSAGIVASSTSCGTSSNAQRFLVISGSLVSRITTKDGLGPGVILMPSTSPGQQNNLNTNTNTSAKDEVPLNLQAQIIGWRMVHLTRRNGDRLLVLLNAEIRLAHVVLGTCVSIMRVVCAWLWF
ncbi:hypothetical protein V8F06_014737 [Rhypophila decipiens]